MRRAGIVPIAFSCFLAVAGLAAPSYAASPARYCARIGTDDTQRPLPRALVPKARQLFNLTRMPARQIRRSTYFRCFDRRVLLCNTGANLPCGKANTSRQLPAAGQWCAAHPGSDFIPAYVTGHDTIYRWRCDGPNAAAGAAVFHVDKRGFIAEFWKAAD